MANANEPPARVSPLDFLKTWADANPQQAAILLSGIACFAAVAIVLGFGIDLQANVKNVYIVVACGVALFLVTRILNNELMTTVLTWFALAMGLLWAVAFVSYKAALGDAVLHQRLGCVVYFWQDCQFVADALAADAAANSGSETGQEQLTEITKAQPEAPTRNLAVTVQFAGAIDRATIRAMMKDLASKSWSMRGTEGGGERTANAAGYAEVRYSGNNKTAAEALAKAVSAYAIANRPLKVVPTSAVKANELEVWISN